MFMIDFFYKPKEEMTSFSIQKEGYCIIKSVRFSLSKRPNNAC